MKKFGAGADFQWGIMMKSISHSLRQPLSAGNNLNGGTSMMSTVVLIWVRIDFNSLILYCIDNKLNK